MVSPTGTIQSKPLSRGGNDFISFPARVIYLDKSKGHTAIIIPTVVRPFLPPGRPYQVTVASLRGTLT